MTKGYGNLKQKRSGSQSQFPGKLHNMMEYVEREGLDSVISWVLNGRGFVIHNPDKLVDMLPLFFSQTKYRSFRRQLNMWHFQRILQGPNKGVFMHPYFVRDNMELCGCMSRHVSLQPRNIAPVMSTQKENKPVSTTSSFDNRNLHINTPPHNNIDIVDAKDHTCDLSDYEQPKMSSLYNNITPNTITSSKESSMFCSNPDDLTPLSLEYFEQKNDMRVTLADLSNWLETRKHTLLFQEPEMRNKFSASTVEEIPSGDNLISSFDATDEIVDFDDIDFEAFQ